MLKSTYKYTQILSLETLDLW